MHQRLDCSDSTAYGASTRTIETAVSVLRARGAIHAHPTVPAAPLTSAVAVVGAEMWCTVTESSSLAQPARHGTPACTALAAVIGRACGTAPVGRCDAVVTLEVPPSWMAAAEGAWGWVEQFLPGQGAHVLRLAAQDLATGATPAWETAAALLMDVAGLAELALL
jgi:hypothetical protein